MKEKIGQKVFKIVFIQLQQLISCLPKCSQSVVKKGSNETDAETILSASFLKCVCGITISKHIFFTKRTYCYCFTYTLHIIQKSLEIVLARSIFISLLCCFFPSVLICSIILHCLYFPSQENPSVHTLLFHSQKSGVC